MELIHPVPPFHLRKSHWSTILLLIQITQIQLTSRIITCSTNIISLNSPLYRDTVRAMDRRGEYFVWSVPAYPHERRGEYRKPPVFRPHRSKPYFKPRICEHNVIAKDSETAHRMEWTARNIFPNLSVGIPLIDSTETETIESSESDFQQLTSSQPSFNSYLLLHPSNPSAFAEVDEHIFPVRRIWHTYTDDPDIGHPVLKLLEYYYNRSVFGYLLFRRYITGAYGA